MYLLRKYGPTVIGGALFLGAAYLLWSLYQARMNAQANSFLSTETAASLPVYTTDVIATYVQPGQLNPTENTTQTPNAASTATAPSVAGGLTLNSIPAA